MNEIAAQAFVFFLAGFETSSSTLSFLMYEMALNPDYQNKLRDEIRSVLKKYDGNITYEAINEMTYMDKVIDGKKEVIRKDLFFLSKNNVSRVLKIILKLKIKFQKRCGYILLYQF